MQPKSDWKLVRWLIEDPTDPRPAAGPDGVPAVRFERSRQAVTLVFERSGDLREVRFAGPGLTVEGLRHVRVGELVEQARSHLSDLQSAMRGHLTRALADLDRAGALLDDLEIGNDYRARADHLKVQVAAAHQQLTALEGFRRPSYVGGPRKTDQELAVIAAEYVRRCVNGEEKVSGLARSMGCPQATLSTQIQMARKRSLLGGEPQRGTAVGFLTKKAEKVLEAMSRRAMEVQG